MGIGRSATVTVDERVEDLVGVVGGEGVPDGFEKGRAARPLAYFSATSSASGHSIPGDDAPPKCIAQKLHNPHVYPVRTALLVVLAVLVALAAGWHMGARRSSAELEALAVLPPMESSLPASVAVSTPQAPVAPSTSVDDDIEDLLKPSVEEAPATAETKPAVPIPGMPGLRGQRMAQIDRLMDEGSTLATDPYEVEPGVYNFSTLTPRLSVLNDGAAGVQLDVKRYQFDVSGGYYVDFDQSVPMTPGIDSGINFQEGNQGFASILRVELQPGTGQVRIMSSDYKTEGASPSPSAAGGSAPGEVP